MREHSRMYLCAHMPACVLLIADSLFSCSQEEANKDKSDVVVLDLNDDGLVTTEELLATLKV